MTSCPLVARLDGGSAHSALAPRGAAVEPPYRPSQAEVDAKADELFGPGWRVPYQEQIRWADGRIAAKLDEARAAVEKEHQ